MSYAASRDHAQTDMLDVATKYFITRYKANLAMKRMTVFLFPGGEGSKLYRAKKPYLDGGAPIQHFDFELNWLELDSFLGSALDLEMTMMSDGSYRDTENRIVVANGSCSLFCVDPYAGFRSWCEDMGIDWFTYGWDWRRPIEDAADFFVHRFLPRFQAAVIAECGTDPLADYVLIGHSFGGMVVTNLARRPALLANCCRAITVASPFYGYGGQIHRWFEGDDMFPLSPVADIIRTISSFPGCYALPYLSEDSFDVIESRISNGPYALAHYPSTDPTNPKIDVDPFHPKASQYPSNTGFSLDALAAGALTSKALGTPIDSPLQARLTCIRGVVTDNAHQPVDGTPGGLTWRRLPPGPYSPDETPLVDGPTVPGDGTLPAWTTALIGADTIDISNPAVEHIFLLENAETQAQLAALLACTPIAGPLGELLPTAERPFEAASSRTDVAGGSSSPMAERGELDRLLDELRSLRLTALSPQRQREAARAVIERRSVAELNALARRALADLLKPRSTRRAERE